MIENHLGLAHMPAHGKGDESGDELDQKHAAPAHMRQQ
jgi:hypothetical protein